jgi:hypothetical protein
LFQFDSRTSTHQHHHKTARQNFLVDFEKSLEIRILASLNLHVVSRFDYEAANVKGVVLPPETDDDIDPR